jgi:hypothetical protein
MLLDVAEKCKQENRKGRVVQKMRPDPFIQDIQGG